MDLLVNRVTGQFLTGVARDSNVTLEEDDWIVFMPTGSTSWLRLVDDEWISYEGFKASEIQQRVGELVARMAADVLVEVKPPVAGPSGEPTVVSNATVYRDGSIQGPVSFVTCYFPGIDPPEGADTTKVREPVDEVHERHVEVHRQLVDQIRQKEEGELRKLAMKLAVKSLSRTPAEIINTAERYFKFLKGES